MLTLMHQLSKKPELVQEIHPAMLNKATTATVEMLASLIDHMARLAEIQREDKLAKCFALVCMKIP